MVSYAQIMSLFERGCHMYQQKISDTPKIGQVYSMKFEGSGSEQSGWRPGVIIQNDIGNKFSPNVIAVPLTSAIKKESQPTHVKILAEDSGLARDSIVLCENPERMNKARIGNYICTLSDAYMEKIAEGSLVATGVVAFLDVETLISIRNRVASMNMRTRYKS